MQLSIISKVDMCSSRQAESNVFNMLAVFYQSWLVKSKICKNEIWTKFYSTTVKIYTNKPEIHKVWKIGWSWCLGYHNDPFHLKNTFTAKLQNIQNSKILGCQTNGRKCLCPIFVSKSISCKSLFSNNNSIIS